MSYIGPAPNPGQNREVDDISSGFNGSEVNFTLQVNSQNVSPGSSNAIIVSLGGVVQNPGTDYNIAASTITFTTAPANGLSFFGLVLGQQVDIQSVADSASIVSPTLSGPTVTGDLSIADKIIHTGDTNTAIRFPSADTIQFETSGSDRFKIDSSGHAGLGVTPDDSWPSNGDFKAFQIGTGACVFGRGSGDEDRGGITVNYYHTGSAEKYLANGNASGMLLNDGDIDFFVAAANSSGVDAAMSKTTAMRIAADADIGIGTLDPDGRLHIVGGNLTGAGSVTANTSGDLLVLESNTSQGMSFLNANDERASIFFGTTGTNGNQEASISYAHEAVSSSGDRRRMIFKVAGNTEKVRVQSDGVDVSGSVIVHATAVNPSVDIEQQVDANYSAIRIRHFKSTSGRNMLSFLDNNGSVVGSIVNDGSGITYNTTSDYRLKENVVSISDGISRLKTLKPYRFNFKADPTETLDGFLAHEVTAVPEAINGTKDAVVTQEMIDKKEWKQEELGNNINQGLDHSKLVPLLTAALQEAIAKIETLETKVAALEAA